ncbi:unnamed protein product, partial [Mesorhabditis belari]|uniref:Uncharacterized protein n=1 Tax=Mesorhabditis belari TaxID=2138241 RepID=A0AAF3ERI7_9BILA
MVFLINKRGFFCISKNFSRSGSYLANWWALVFYMHTFAQSLSLLGVHCLFRYSMITGQFQFLFKRWWGILLLFVIHFTVAGLYACFGIFGLGPTDFRRFHWTEDMKNYMGITIDDRLYYFASVFKYLDENGQVHYGWDILGGSGCFLVCGIFYTIVCWTGIKLYSFVKKSVMPATKKRIQLQLLNVLLAQAISPLVCECLPVGAVVYGGILGIVQPYQGIYVTTFVSGYSAVDALLTLILFRAYRRRALTIFLAPFNGCKTVGQVYSLTKTSKGLNSSQTTSENPAQTIKQQE